MNKTLSKNCIICNKLIFNKKSLCTRVWDKRVKFCSKECKYKGPNKGGFKKGQTPWNKDKKGYMGANETSFKKGCSPWNMGKKVPQMSGENHPLFGKTFQWTEEQKANLKVSRDQRREKHPNWIADRSKIKVGDRFLNDPLQKQWR